MYVYFTVFLPFQFTFSLYYIYQSDVSKTIRLFYNSREIKYNCLHISSIVYFYQISTFKIASTFLYLPISFDICYFDIFELWCWRRLLRVPRTARRSNQSVLKVSPGCSLEGLMLKLKLQYFGHLMRRVDSLEKTLMLGGIGGRRRRG